MKEIWTRLREKFASTTLPIKPVLSPRSNGKNVLVVDDDHAVCQIVQRMLSDEQYQVQTSQSVADALEAVEQKPFDAYVMDYKLPDGSGLDVAERIRSKWGATPIILISGHDPSAVALRGEKLHIFDFLQKTFLARDDLQRSEEGDWIAQGRTAHDSVKQSSFSLCL